MTAPDLTPMLEPEELHDDLKEYLENNGQMEMLRHPLVYAVPYFPQENRRLNQQLQAKQEMVEKSIAKGNWGQLLAMYERPYRPQMLAEWASSMSDADYWKQVRSTWMDSENIRQEAELWDDLLFSDRPGHEHAFDQADLDMLNLAFARNPKHERVRVYRGHTQQQDGWRGLSWTLNEEVAIWFAKRNASLHGGRPLLSSGFVKRESIRLAISGRNESEIVADPSTFISVVTTSLKGKAK